MTPPVGEELSLFPVDDDLPETEMLASGAVLLRRYASDVVPDLVSGINSVAQQSPWRHMSTRQGFKMSVAMTNCGDLGWITDRSGYRYDGVDPGTGKPWPTMPEAFRSVARAAATSTGYENFEPDSCLINCYEVGSKMALHQDRNERSFDQPIVSVSIGLPATFMFGGMSRTDRPERYILKSGDVVVWGGPSRLNFHGVLPLKAGNHPLAGPKRFNLTFRMAG